MGGKDNSHSSVPGVRTAIITSFRAGNSMIRLEKTFIRDWIMLLYVEDFSNGKSFFLALSFSQLDLVAFSHLSFPSLPFPYFFPVYSCPFFSPFFFYSYIYEVSRRNPFVFTPTLLRVTDLIEEMTKTCCEEHDKANCFRARVSIAVNSMEKDKESSNTVDPY